MEEIQSTSQLNLLGLERWDIERLLQAEQLERVRRGAYAVPLPADAAKEDRHRRLIAATIPQLDPAAVLSHSSAAILHDLPVWRPGLQQVHVTRSRSTGGQRRRLVHLHVAPLTAGDTELIDGFAVTTAARTVLDLARSLPFRHAVAVADRALAAGLSPDLLDMGLASMVRWPGVRRARRTCGFADHRSESVGESVSRVDFAQVGLPTPTPQYEVLDEFGRLLARCDLGWEEHGTVGEFDGKVKYGRLLRPGQRVEEVVYAEKLREDALRDHGWQVVRWTWDDLRYPALVRDRILRAFARADRCGLPDGIGGSTS